ncbi:MAG TPA: PEP-CTERM sorting domain-containing protein [Steroidobacteraceae bacterium]|nr:PEP-CTERM sorting domain-containing protein [Steroidobacteraceae bacterium]
MNRKIVAIGCTALVGALCAAPHLAHAQIAALGTQDVFQGVNSPTSFTEYDTLTLGTTTTEAGTLDVNLSIVPNGHGGEWDIFTFESASALAGTLDADWSIYGAYYITQNAVFSGFYLGFGTDGSLISPTSDTGSILPEETNPVTGSGQVFGQGYDIPVSGFVNFNAYTDTFDSALTGWGYAPVDVNTVQIAVELNPVNAGVPEPATLAIFGSALAGLALVRRKRQ